MRREKNKSRLFKQPLNLNNQQVQPYQLQTRLIEDIFSKDHLNQEEAANELKKLLKESKKLIGKI